MDGSSTTSPVDALITAARADLSETVARAQRADADAGKAESATIEAESRAKQARNDAKRLRDAAKELAKQQQNRQKHLDQLLKQQSDQVQSDHKAAEKQAKSEAEAREKQRKKFEKDERKIREEAEKARQQAERFKENPEATAGLLAQASARLGDGEQSGPLQGVLEDLLTLLRLVGAYTSGAYREVPWDTVAMAIGAVIYFVSPVDLIPDVLPVIGLVDDATVIGFVVNKIRDDLDEFREWERRNARGE